ncbi:MAG: hypothetical protein EP330_19580 [Deltaproteobacteria bacterium]|nr:MAG: hypothetical protein EP330_19580 [Deltaproteobacteria bacterium]
MLYLLLSVALAWTVEVEERVHVSELDLWTSEIPSLALDGDGQPWLGYTTRYEGERYATCGVASRGHRGWDLRKDLLESCHRAVVAADDNGHIVVFGSAANTRVLHADEGFQLAATLDGYVRAAPSASVAWAIDDGFWVRHRYVDGRWVRESTGERDLNKGHENAITASGILLRTQVTGEGWHGYSLVAPDNHTLVLATDEHFVARAVEVDGTLVTALQMNAGGGPAPASPIVVHRFTGTPLPYPRHDEKLEGAEVLATTTANPPSCPIEGSRCAETGTRSLLLGLTPRGDALIAEQTVAVEYHRKCDVVGKRHPTGPPGSTYQPPPCLRLGGWHERYAVGEVRSASLRIGEARVPLAVMPGKDIASAEHDGVLHLAWYEESASGVDIRYVRLRRD